MRQTTLSSSTVAEIKRALWLETRRMYIQTAQVKQSVGRIIPPGYVEAKPQYTDADSSWTIGIIAAVLEE